MKECREIDVDVYNFKVVFKYRNFKSNDYQTVKRHFLKRNNRVGMQYPYVHKSQEVFLKQKALLNALIKDAKVSVSTITTLMRYKFLDDSIYSLVNRLYYALTSTDYNTLRSGEDIRYGIEQLARG